MSVLRIATSNDENKILVTNYGVTVNGNYIKFEGMSHDGFLSMIYIASGMSYDDLEQYKEERASKGIDPYSEELLRIVTGVINLKANQFPLTYYPKHVASNYYQDNVINSKPVLPGSIIENVRKPRSK